MKEINLNATYSVCTSFFLFSPTSRRLLVYRQDSLLPHRHKKKKKKRTREKIWRATQFLFSAQSPLLLLLLLLLLFLLRQNVVLVVIGNWCRTRSIRSSSVVFNRLYMNNIGRNVGNWGTTRIFRQSFPARHSPWMSSVAQIKHRFTLIKTAFTNCGQISFQQYNSPLNDSIWRHLNGHSARRIKRPFPLSHGELAIVDQWRPSKHRYWFSGKFCQPGPLA